MDSSFLEHADFKYSATGLRCIVTGICAPDVGLAVCDIHDNACGFRDDEGPCAIEAGMAVDRTHTSLNGACASEAAALVHGSGVCDMTDDQCEFAEGHGPCRIHNGTLACRSGLCSGNCKSGVGWQCGGGHAPLTSREGIRHEK